MRPYRLPAMANVHSHAFQVDLRGVAERPARRGSPSSTDDSPSAVTDDFWSWREAMYALATGHDPESMREAGARVYAEMAAAGYGAVGEFHYVHHQPSGCPYDDPNAMAIALAEAGVEAGLRVVLLPAAYNRAGEGRPATDGQRRFCDPTVEAFLERVDSLRAWASAHPRVSVGVAAHSIRAVPASWLEAIADYADRHRLVRHVHAHEQPREIAECEAEYGMTPIALLERTGFLGPRTTLVHGVHVTTADIDQLAESDTILASCPTTEGSLGDGYFPALRYRDAGVRIAIGSDSQVIVDPFEETRELETLARRERHTRDALLSRGDLWSSLVEVGCASLGIDDAGFIEIDLDHRRLQGVQDEDVPFAVATCATADVVVKGSS